MWIMGPRSRPTKSDTLEPWPSKSYQDFSVIWMPFRVWELLFYMPVKWFDDFFLYLSSVRQLTFTCNCRRVLSLSHILFSCHFHHCWLFLFFVLFETWDNEGEQQCVATSPVEPSWSSSLITLWSHPCLTPLCWAAPVKNLNFSSLKPKQLYLVPEGMHIFAFILTYLSALIRSFWPVLLSSTRVWKF